ncbi:helix-turn-helix transcriptional regulator [Streptomyces filamentosus]|uniref:helix-turn-helix transcriptional regulator n=1 Tax=Streptomyces filamentosus TaxID=67294 RepID=UPI0036EF03C7
MGTRGRAERILTDDFRESPDFAVGVHCREVSELPGIASVEFLRSPHRCRFHLLILAHGDCPPHMVDFAEHRLRAGEALWLRPGQVHRFGPLADYRARYVVARPGLLGPKAVSLTRADSHALPTLLRPDAAERPRVDAAMTHLRSELDHGRGLPAVEVDECLRHLFTVLLLHLRRTAERQAAAGAGASGGAAGAAVEPLFTAYREEVERRYAEGWSVDRFAQRLGYSRRSLDRAVRAATGGTAKAYLDDRVALEAKRLLAHTVLPAWRVGRRLGFADAANFTKFFRKHAGTTPAAFRRAVTVR